MPKIVLLQDSYEFYVPSSELRSAYEVNVDQETIDRWVAATEKFEAAMEEFQWVQEEMNEVRLDARKKALDELARISQEMGLYDD